MNTCTNLALYRVFMQLVEIENEVQACTMDYKKKAILLYKLQVAMDMIAAIKENHELDQRAPQKP